MVTMRFHRNWEFIIAQSAQRNTHTLISSKTSFLKLASSKPNDQRLLLQQVIRKLYSMMHKVNILFDPVSWVLTLIPKLGSVFDPFGVSRRPSAPPLPPSSIIRSNFGGFGPTLRPWARIQMKPLPKLMKRQRLLGYNSVIILGPSRLGNWKLIIPNRVPGRWHARSIQPLLAFMGILAISAWYLWTHSCKNRRAKTLYQETQTKHKPPKNGPST